MIVYQIALGVAYAVRIFESILFLYCILTWFVPRDTKLMQVLLKLVGPVLRPVQRLILRFTHNPVVLSLSPLILALLLQVGVNLLLRLARIFL